MLIPIMDFAILTELTLMLYYWLFCSHCRSVDTYKFDSYTVKPVLSDHAWAKKKWSLNRGGLLIEVRMHCKATIGTRPK